MSGRIGCFFMFFGLILMVIFLASDIAKSPTLSYLFWGILVMLIGVLFWRHDYSPPPPAERFRLFRKKPKKKKPN